MPWIRGFGCYLPARIVTNTELAPMVGADPEWMVHATGIRERRFAAPGESVASLGIAAGKDCLANCRAGANEVGMVLAASGSGELRFPGPATTIAAALSMPGTPAIDLPMASAGTLFGLALAANLTGEYGNVLVIGSEIMSRVVRLDPLGKDTAILFGDGAGACLVSRDPGPLRIVGSMLASDGEFAETLKLHWDSPLYMDGRSIILHASRKLPRIMGELLARHTVKAEAVGAYILHQANLNLITRVAQALGAPSERFYRNLDRYGNTSSASLLIAAAEWWREVGARWDGPVMLAAFGAGLNWGALLGVGE